MKLDNILNYIKKNLLLNFLKIYYILDIIFIVIYYSSLQTSEATFFKIINE